MNRSMSMILESTSDRSSFVYDVKQFETVQSLIKANGLSKQILIIIFFFYYPYSEIVTSRKFKQ